MDWKQTTALRLLQREFIERLRSDRLLFDEQAGKHTELQQFETS